MAELQFPNVVGSYLATYNQQRQQKMAEEDQQFQRQRMERQDDRADIMQKLQMMDGVVKTLGNANDDAGLERAKQQWVAMGLPAEAVAAYTAADIPMLREKAGVQFEALKGELLKEQVNAQRANIRQSDAAADASRANAAYIRGGKMGAGAGGGKYGAGGKPLTERESKDLSWALRGDAANKEFTPDRISALIDTRNVIGRNVPVVGNKLQTDKSRQAVQTAKNFVAVVLRKDTGAAVTEKEFDFYEDIFIPAWGDDDGTLQMKAQARSGFLNALKMGLGPRAALAQLGVQPPEGLAPPEDDKTSVIEAQGGGWSATVEE